MADDVRQHLEAALEAISREKHHHTQELQRLATQEKLLTEMLQTPQPGIGFGTGRRLTPIVGVLPVSSDSNRLAEFIERHIKSHGPATTGQLMAAAKTDGVPYKDGRSFNATLLTLRLAGRAEKLDDARWRLVS